MMLVCIEHPCILQTIANLETSKHKNKEYYGRDCRKRQKEKSSDENEQHGLTRAT